MTPGFGHVGLARGHDADPFSLHPSGHLTNRAMSQAGRGWRRLRSQSTRWLRARQDALRFMRLWQRTR